MQKLLNNLYITTAGSYLRKERETLVIEQQGAKIFQLPTHNLHNLFCFGHIMASPDLLASCAEKGIGVAFFTEYGKFQYRIQGRQSGNILLRRAQYRESDSKPAKLSRLFIAAKLANSRELIMRRIRNHGETPELSKLVNNLARLLQRLQSIDDLEKIRGLEGEAAAAYFGVFNQLIASNLRADFPFNGRSKRPPMDKVNALISWAYTLLGQEIGSALQAVGLDPHAGFLHRDRPGRLSLAQDMLEEFRAWWCDRLALTLINRRQIVARDFVTEASGAVRLDDKARKQFLQAWQSKKHETITHPYTAEKIAIGLLPHIQAQLLARYLRGDMENYPPFIAR